MLQATMKSRHTDFAVCGREDTPPVDTYGLRVTSDRNPKALGPDAVPMNVCACLGHGDSGYIGDFVGAIGFAGPVDFLGDERAE